MGSARHGAGDLAALAVLAALALQRDGPAARRTMGQRRSPLAPTTTPIFGAVQLFGDRGREQRRSWFGDEHRPLLHRRFGGEHRPLLHTARAGAQHCPRGTATGNGEARHRATRLLDARLCLAHGAAAGARAQRRALAEAQHGEPQGARAQRRATRRRRARSSAADFAGAQHNAVDLSDGTGAFTNCVVSGMRTQGNC